MEDSDYTNPEEVLGAVLAAVENLSTEEAIAVLTLAKGLIQHEPTGFDVSFSGESYLAINEIWPDGDAPAHPTAHDVKRVMEASGAKVHVLKDWALLLDLEVSVDGVKVWPRPDRAKG